MPKTLKLPVAKVGEIAEGTMKKFRYGVQNGIAYNDKGTIRAYLDFCPHAGGTFRLTNGARFQCQLHAAEFDAHTGARLSGQAPEGSVLKSIPLHEEDGMIYAFLEFRDEI